MKRLLSPKTIKKGLPRMSNEGISILTDCLHDKKPKLEYFEYCNRSIPIENSSQRRLVFRIQMIDEERKYDF